mgnify:CR=1 FL=1
MLLILGAIDRRIADRMECCGYLILRISLGIVFAWFSALTLFGLIGLLYRPLLWAALLLLFLQMSGTTLPLVLLLEVCFTVFLYGLPLEGQYII